MSGDGIGCMFVCMIFIAIFFLGTVLSKDYEYTTVLEYSDGSRETIVNQITKPCLNDQGCVISLKRCGVRKIICISKKEID